MWPCWIAISWSKGSCKNGSSLPGDGVPCRKQALCVHAGARPNAKRTDLPVVFGPRVWTGLYLRLTHEHPYTCARIHVHRARLLQGLASVRMLIERARVQELREGVLTLQHRPDDSLRLSMRYVLGFPISEDLRCHFLPVCPRLSSLTSSVAHSCA